MMDKEKNASRIFFDLIISLIHYSSFKLSDYSWHCVHMPILDYY